MPLRFTISLHRCSKDLDLHTLGCFGAMLDERYFTSLILYKRVSECGSKSKPVICQGRDVNASASLQVATSQIFIKV